ncbi:MAG: STAS domain-containing protein, partial [Mizugakiibacter sp.]|uniref:STAS domain-containing protein n=1 Tax=Mizugakiibacter sp. TaxID=1972610 RepID=UPI00320D34F5
ALDDGAQPRLDLGDVAAADSAGLACVLALLARARRAGRALAVANLPAHLRALARVCDVEALLGAA